MGKILKVTMEDVAKAAGVTQATVSMALRKNPKISQATQEYVARIASELGYRSDGTISMLMGRIRQAKPINYRSTLGLLIPHSQQQFIENETFGRYLEGATKRADELGFGMEKFWIQDPMISAKRLRDILTARSIEGLIIFPMEFPGILEMDFSGFAVSTIGYTVSGIQVHRAVTAHYEAMVTILDKIARAGYSRPGLVLDCSLNDRIERKWLAAFLAYRSGNRTNEKSAPFLLTNHADDGSDFQEWFKSEDIDLLIAANLPAKRWLDTNDTNQSKNPDLVYLGERYSDPEIATVNEHSAHVGAVAVDIVVDQLNRNELGLPKHPQVVEVMGLWEKGKSLKKLES